ncbi:MAG: hypothetical protein P8Y97_04165 [Candidatus Lokiarchaeota archaeon]
MSIFLVEYFFKNGIKGRISNIQKDYIDLINNKKELLKKDYAKKRDELDDLYNNLLNEVENQKLFYSQQKEYYSIKSNLIKFKAMMDYYSIQINEDSIYSHLKENFKGEIEIEVVSDYLQKYEKIPKSIFKLLYNEYYSKPNDKIWQKIKTNPKLIDYIIQIMIKADKITPKYKKIPLNIIIRIMESQNIISIDIINQNINYIAQFVTEIDSFYSYLKEEQILYKEYILWEEILKWKDIFIYKPKFNEDYWKAFTNCIQLNIEIKYDIEIKHVILFYYLEKIKSEILKSFAKKISDSEVSSKILFFISRNIENDKLGDFISEKEKEIIESVEKIKIKSFFEIFHEQLSKGNFIIDSNDLFKIHVNEGVFDLSYLNRLFFNPLNPIDFEYAFNYYFTLNTTITSLLRTLKMEGKQTLFLLTFTSKKGRGGIAKAINELTNEEIFPGLANKYELLQYSDNARIGISKEKIFNIEDLRKEMLIDLKKTIPKLDVANELNESIIDLIEKCYVPIQILNPEEIDDLKAKCNDFINLKIQSSNILKIFLNINQKIESNEKYNKVKDDYNLIWKNLKEMIRNYPPNYQILLHKLENDPKKIEVFGNYQKFDPFVKIKKLYANKTKNKETLLISAEFQEDSYSKVSIEEINQKLINSLPFISLVSNEIPKLKVNSQFEEILDFNFLDNIISLYSSKSQSLIEFCLSLTDEMGLNDVFYYDLKEYSENIKRIIDNNMEIVEKVIKILKNELSEYNKLFDENIIDKIGTTFIKSCTCISLTIFNRIQDAYKFFKEEEFKKLKMQLLNDIDLDIIREKKFNLLFYSLLNYYRSNKIRPIFKSEEPANESLFHDKVLAYLFNYFPHDIEDEHKVAKGKLDLLVQKIPIELKFEKKESKVGFLYVFENTEKKSGYPKNDIQCFHEDGYYCIVILLRGNFPYSSHIKKKK